MKILKSLSVLALAVSIILPAGAQTAAPQTAKPNIAERISEESGGNVTIEIPENILNELYKEEAPKTNTGPKTNDGQKTLKPGINKINGFRIQVFSDGTNQHSLESRAKARGNAIAARFPKYRGQVYSYSSAPNWYTRVGNFETQQEASKALGELKAAFPQYAGDMRIVKCQVVIKK